MRNIKYMPIGILFLILAVVASSLVWMYLINIYEVKYITSENHLPADNRSELTITAVPVNSFGKHAWFRKAEADFYIEEGDQLVDIVSADRKTDKFIIKSKKAEGEVVILIKSNKSYLPVKVVIPIHGKNKDNYL